VADHAAGRVEGHPVRGVAGSSRQPEGDGLIATVAAELRPVVELLGLVRLLAGGGDHLPRCGSGRGDRDRAEPGEGLLDAASQVRVHVIELERAHSFYPFRLPNTSRVSGGLCLGNGFSLPTHTPFRGGVRARVGYILGYILGCLVFADILRARA